MNYLFFGFQLYLGTIQMNCIQTNKFIVISEIPQKYLNIYFLLNGIIRKKNV